MEGKINQILSKLMLLDEIHTHVEQTKADINVFKQKYLEMQNKIVLLENKIESQAHIIHILDKQARKRNLMLFGMAEAEHSQTELLNKTKQTLSHNLKIDIIDTEIDELHRIGKKDEDTLKGNPRPILICFTSSKVKTAILSNRKLLKGKGLFIRQDLTKQERQIRKEKFTLNYTRSEKLLEDENNLTRKTGTDRHTSKKNLSQHTQKPKQEYLNQTQKSSRLFKHRDKYNTNSKATLDNFLTNHFRSDQIVEQSVLAL